MYGTLSGPSSSLVLYSSAAGDVGEPEELAQFRMEMCLQLGNTALNFSQKTDWDGHSLNVTHSKLYLGVFLTVNHSQLFGKAWL